MEQESRRIEQFYVPSGFIKGFAAFMQKYILENYIAGVDDDDIVIFVSYAKSEQEVIDAIQKAIAKYVDDESNGNWRLNGFRE